jgi:hypothetical protein
MPKQGESKPDSDSRQAAEHVKKQEQPQTHQDGETQKLVDRIEKKVSDQKLTVPKRNLRVVKWVGTVPAIGFCTYCNRQFKTRLDSMKRVADAQESLRVQFTEHKCEREDASQSSARRGTKNSS